MEYIIQSRSKKMKKYLEIILPSMLNQLGLTNARKALVVTLEPDCKDLGLTVAMDAIDSFVIVIRSTQSIKQVGLTLAHELVHVRQIAKGFLKTSTRGSHIWAGKRYPEKTPYLSRPWELDAFARQEIIFRRAIEE